LGVDFGCWLLVLFLVLILGGAAVHRCGHNTVAVPALAAEVINGRSPQR